MLHTIGDFERLGDHAVNLMETAKEIFEKKIVFSDKADSEILSAKNALKEILSLTNKAFADNDVATAKKVEPLEQVIDDVTETIKFNHIERLQSGACTIEHGFVLSDLLTNFERVSDHCSNIAVAIIETNKNSYNTHEYLSEVKNNNDPQFTADYEAFKAKYGI